MVKDKFNIEPQMIAKIKAQLGHIFDVDEGGNLTLKPIENIPPFKMIYVKGGIRKLGDEIWDDNPPHEVELAYNYFLGEFPVIQELYQAVTGNNPSRFQGLKDPVEQVNWGEAVEFCNLLNKKIGLQPVCNEKYEFLYQQSNPTDDITKVIGFRLPSETEWEYAACGGASTSSAADLKKSSGFAMLFAGSNYLDEVGWYDQNNKYETKPVGLKFPNALGIYDMSGNVWEWCLDWYERDYYIGNSKHINPVNLKTGSVRLSRGGSWISYAGSNRMANRRDRDPSGSWISRGFRLLFAFQFT
jgi:formylglycine-generating enzyme